MSASGMEEMVVPLEQENKRLKVQLKKARKRIRELEARLREKKDQEEFAGPFAIKKENWRMGQ